MTMPGNSVLCHKDCTCWSASASTAPVVPSGHWWTHGWSFPKIFWAEASRDLCDAFSPTKKQKGGNEKKKINNDKGKGEIEKKRWKKCYTQSEKGGMNVKMRILREVKDKTSKYPIMSNLSPHIDTPFDVDWGSHCIDVQYTSESVQWVHRFDTPTHYKRKRIKNVESLVTHPNQTFHIQN